MEKGSKEYKKEFTLITIIMVEARFINQIGAGVDQHGHNKDCTNAAIKAIKNAISNNCLCGLSEICNFREPKDINRMVVHVKIGAPYPDKIDEKKVLEAIPFGEKSIEVVKGGLLTEGVMIRELGDTSDQIIVCNAAVTVSVKI
ncbi:MAG: Lin0512 family protein [Promethearchaeota archaeon]